MRPPSVEREQVDFGCLARRGVFSVRENHDTNKANYRSIQPLLPPLPDRSQPINEVRSQGEALWKTCTPTQHCIVNDCSEGTIDRIKGKGQLIGPRKPQDWSALRQSTDNYGVRVIRLNKQFAWRQKVKNDGTVSTCYP